MYKMSKLVYINKTVFHMLLFEWFKRVIEGYEDLEDDQEVGELLTAQNLGALQKWFKLMARDRYLKTDIESTRHSPRDNSSDD
jgi:hypothetical protein